MPPPRFKHAFEHDVFLSYTHTDDRPEGEQQIRWVTTFMTDLRIRLEAVSGHTVDIWRDEEKLGAADRFNDTIAHAVSNSAIMLVILSPAYFTSDYCSLERQKFCEQTHPVTASLSGTGNSISPKILQFEGAITLAWMMSHRK